MSLLSDLCMIHFLHTWLETLDCTLSYTNFLTSPALRAQSEELHNFLMLIPQVTQSLKTHFLGYLSDHIVFGLAGFSFLLSSRFIPSILLEIQSVALLIIKLILSLEFKRVRVSFRIKIYSFFFTPIFFLLSFLAGLSLWFQLLDQHGRLQSSLRENWVWPSWNQTTDLLEHTLLQDLSGDEDRPADRPHCHQQTDQLLVLVDCWWTLPLTIAGSKHVEVADWFPRFTANQL